MAMFDLRSSIVKSVFDCHLSGLFKSKTLISLRPFNQNLDFPGADVYEGVGVRFADVI